jgi:Spy/CpxP family protein refolding chaperone
MKQNILVTAAFVLTFAAGVLTGAFLVREFAAPPPEFERGFGRPGPGMAARPRHDLEELQKRLDLNDAQRQQIALLLGKYRDQLVQHFKQVRQPVDALMRQMREETEQILTPEQREKFRHSPKPFDRLLLPPRPELFARDSTLKP